ncbi:NUDIX hydrolase [Marinobacter caseinilyticus]|uniref:NUDIX hydrolase n=1 Tax=Marinobacter caseinilyticus TaxID=2692195 RepID=UPI00140B21BB|nr:CoA pyrophosphatase [Marinobacter caseinilyticus]
MSRTWAAALRPRKLPFRRRVTRASVALIYRRPPGLPPELLFIQRAHCEGDPWSGDMAFPGGRLQADDTGSRAAALRETLEETGLDLSHHGHYRARLSDLLTRHHSRWRLMVVTPYVFEWRGPDTPTLNHEVQQTVWIPLDYLAAGENQSVRLWQTLLGKLRMPCCCYQGCCIWGLSYSMMREMLARNLAEA